MIRRIAIFKNASVRAGFLPIMGVCINATKLPILIGFETDFMVYTMIYGKSDRTDPKITEIIISLIP